MTALVSLGVGMLVLLVIRRLMRSARAAGELLAELRAEKAGAAFDAHVEQALMVAEPGLSDADIHAWLGGES